MKDFVKMTLAVILGVLILMIAGLFLSIGFFASLAIAGTSATKTVIPKSAVLKVDMSSFVLAEQSIESNPLNSITGEMRQTIGLWDAVTALQKAAEDPSIQYIYLRPDEADAGMAQLYEFRIALEKFRESGKAVIAYMDNVTTAGYFVASAADKIYMTAHEGGTSMFFGISGQLFFLKDILDKLGVNVQLIRHGKYKSAGEMYVNNSPSPENLEQNQVMIDSIWKEYANQMVAHRDITPEQFNALLDDLALNSPEDFLQASLVDGLLTIEDLKNKLASLAVADSFKDVHMVSLQDYVSAKKPVALKTKNKIAVIYADGEIVDGNDKKDVAGDRFAEEIAKVRADSTVNAVVFRVNSPGGSVLASEKIRSEIELLGESVPIVVSYGDYAASGGYWISVGTGKRTFADPVTLTGSIGVFSMIPDLSGTMKNIAHVGYTSVNSNKHSDMLSMMRPLDADETAYLQKSVESIYDRFVSIVAEGRGLSPEYVDSVAQGRVWTGTDALEIGLIDKIGTLEDAVNYAVYLASDESEDVDISKWTVEGFPKPPTTVELLMESLGMKDTGVHAFADTPLASLEKAISQWTASWKKHPAPVMLARMPYEIVWSE